MPRIFAYNNCIQ